MNLDLPLLVPESYLIKLRGIYLKHVASRRRFIVLKPHLLHPSILTELQLRSSLLRMLVSIILPNFNPFLMAYSPLFHEYHVFR
jgi:hypothetical protein